MTLRSILCERAPSGTFAAPEDLSDDAFVLVASRLPNGVVVADVVSAAGVKAADLPSTYPVNRNGSVVSHGRCQRVGAQAHDAGFGGVEARLASTPVAGGRDMAICSGLTAVRPVRRRAPYGRWRGPVVVDAEALFGH